MIDDVVMRDRAPRAATYPRARLRAVHPPEVRWVHELPSGRIELGRTDHDDGTPGLRHGTVSRRHFEVSWDVSFRQHVGRDLGSHNGSRVDGRDLGPVPALLADGSVVQLGDVSLVYERLAADAPTSWPTDPLVVGAAPVLASLVHALERAARDRAPLLLAGEVGTGKRRIARALHHRSGRRGPLRVLDCASLPPHEPQGRARELLGSATGGTLYLEDVGELPPSLQRELALALDVDDAHALDVRVVASTHQELAEHVAVGRLHRDLYACLTYGRPSGALRVPPLRERKGDVLSWIEQLHADWLAPRPGHAVRTLALVPEAVERLLLHGWPGNLHELGRLVHELASDPELPSPIPLHRLPAWLLGGSPDVPTQPVSGPPTPRRPRTIRS